MKKIILATTCYVIATAFLAYEMAVQVSPAVMTSELISDIGLNAKSLSFISAAYFTAYAAMQIPAGILFDRFSAKILLTLATIVCSIGIYCFVLTKSPYILAFGRFITGFGSSFAFIGVLLMAHEWFEVKYFPILVGIAQLLAAIGAMFGEVPLALNIAQQGWQIAVQNLALIGFFLAVITLLFLKNNKTKDTKVTQKNSIYEDLKLIINKKENWLLALYAFTCWGPVTAFAELWGVAFLKSHLLINKTAAAAIASSVWLGIAVGAPVIGYVSSKFDNSVILMRFTSILGLLSTSSILLFNDIIVSHISAFIFGIAAASQILTFTLIKKYIPSNITATSIGFMNMAVVAGGAILQPIIGCIINASWSGKLLNEVPNYLMHDYRNGLIILPICYFICVLSSCLLKSK